MAANSDLHMDSRLKQQLRLHLAVIASMWGSPPAKERIFVPESDSLGDLALNSLLLCSCMTGSVDELARPKWSPARLDYNLLLRWKAA